MIRFQMWLHAHWVATRSSLPTTMKLNRTGVATAPSPPRIKAST